MENIRQKRQLAAIIFTDIVGYTALMGQDEQKALELVRKNREIQKPLVEKHGGKWLKEMGDGTISSFPSGQEAVQCAIEIQQTLRSDLDGKVRIGIHLGDITTENEDVYGDGVNIASRLQAIADPGGIYLSEAIFKIIKGNTEIETSYLGELQLKNVDLPVRTFAVGGSGFPYPDHKHLSQYLVKQSFLAEVQRRRLIRVGVAYIVLALFVIEATKLFSVPLGLPDWTSAFLWTFLVTAFPIALLLAWTYERAPEGFVRTTSAHATTNPYSAAKRKPLTGNIIIAGMVLIIIAMYVYPRYVGNSVEDAEASATVTIDDKSIAVIPFENLSADEENQYFADGQMEAILNHLTKIADLRVISRTTMMGYRGTTKSVPEIAQELGVRYILEGSVQKSGQKVRINAQLIDSDSDKHVWSDNYDRDLTDIFTIQSEIAKSVAEQLSATITP